MSKHIDLIGQRFMRLIVLEHVGSNKYNKSIFRCQCDCGNIFKLFLYLMEGKCQN
jgi:hypothetical protein